MDKLLSFIGVYANGHSYGRESAHNDEQILSFEFVELEEMHMLVRYGNVHSAAHCLSNFHFGLFVCRFLLIC
jgi:hypothetical protein